VAAALRTDPPEEGRTDVDEEPAEQDKAGNRSLAGGGAGAKAAPRTRPPCRAGARRRNGSCGAWRHRRHEAHRRAARRPPCRSLRARPSGRSRRRAPRGSPGRGRAGPDAVIGAHPRAGADPHGALRERSRRPGPPPLSAAASGPGGGWRTPGRPCRRGRRARAVARPGAGCRRGRYDRAVRSAGVARAWGLLVGLQDQCTARLRRSSCLPLIMMRRGTGGR